MTALRSITLSDIQDGGAQMRVEMKPDTVREYADEMAAGTIFPAVAVVVTLLGKSFDPALIIVGLVIGTLIGAVLAVRIQMTAMPQLVALFNGFGGGASVLCTPSTLNLHPGR